MIPSPEVREEYRSREELWLDVKMPKRFRLFANPGREQQLRWRIWFWRKATPWWALPDADGYWPR